jgi:hypothetical protein
MLCRRIESNDILLELVAKTLAVGATEMQVEYEDPRLAASSEEAQALREALYQIPP